VSAHLKCRFQRPDAIADTVIQDAIDAVAAAGGGVVLLGVGDFKLSRHAGDDTVVIKSNVTLPVRSAASACRSLRQSQKSWKWPRS